MKPKIKTNTDQFAVSVDGSCPACKIYDKWLKDKENELVRLNNLINSLREEKQILETRILTLLRVIPASNGHSPSQQQQPLRTTATQSWEQKKKDLEKLGREKAALTKEERIHWEKKAADAAKKEGFEPQKIGEIDVSDG